MEAKKEDLIKIESAGQNEPPTVATDGNEIVATASVEPRNKEATGIGDVDDCLSMGIGELVPMNASCGLVLTCILAKRQDADDIFDDSGMDNGVLVEANICLNGNGNDNEDNALGQSEQETTQYTSTEECIEACMRRSELRMDAICDKLRKEFLVGA